MRQSEPAEGGRRPREAGAQAGAAIESTRSPRDARTWMRRWRERLAPEESNLPEDEARLVVESVLDELDGGHPESLDRAGRAWGRAHRSVSEMVGRLSAFREALAAGGVDDPLKMHRALDRVTAAATEEVLHRLEHASRTDALTGVGNRRAFDETLQAALSAAARQHHDVSVVAVDLDGLKRINDSEGHAAGDAALLGLVRAFYSALRDEDTIFRVGGDEFVILLPFTSVDAAELLMQRVASTDAPAFTWGAAGYPSDATDGRDLLEAADQNLYRRRNDRREPGAHAPRHVRDASAGDRSSRSSAREDELQGSPLLRWAWIPAAGVLLVSLVVALVVAGTPKNQGVFSAAPKTPPSQPVTAPGGSPVVPPPVTSPSSSAPPPTSSATSAPAKYVRRPPVTGGANGSGGRSPSGPPTTTPPPTTTTTPPNQGSGGMLQPVGNLVKDIPVVGQGGGLFGLIPGVGQSGGLLGLIP